MVSKGLNGLSPILVSVFLLGTHDFKGFQGLIRQLKKTGVASSILRIGARTAENQQKTSRKPTEKLGSVVHSDPRLVLSSRFRRDFGAAFCEMPWGGGGSSRTMTQCFSGWWKMRKFESAQETPHFDGIQQNMWKKLINYGKSMGCVRFFPKKASPENLGHPGSLDYFEFTLFMDGVLPSYSINKSNFMSSMFELLILCVYTLYNAIYVYIQW